MNNKIGKRIFISHIDLDGTSEIINRVFGIKYDCVYNTNYGANDELCGLTNPQEINEVVYVDFSPNEEARNIIKQYNIKCKIMDHHESVKEDIENWIKEYPFVEYHFDNRRSGTKIYYDEVKKNYEFNSCLDEYVNLVSTYDLYDEENPYWDKSTQLNRCFFKSLIYYKEGSEKFESFIKSQVYKCEHYEHFDFSPWEIEKIEKDIFEENQLFNSVINGGKETMKTRKDKDGNHFVVVNLKKKASAIAHKLLEKYKGLSYVVVINSYQDEDWKISLRSRKDFDLLQFELTNGHSSACGVDSKFCNVNEIAHKIWEGKKYCFEKKVING